MRFAQLVIGPAGSGKSTYCHVMVQHCEAIRRTVHVVNLDPAAEEFKYPCLADIRDLIQVDDVMDDKILHFGPNGGLVFCLEYLVQNLDWLEEALGEGCADDYILFDCPGQIELYTHINVMKTLVNTLQAWDFRVCAVFLLDTQFMLEMNKFFAGTLVALSTMVGLEIPHVNVLSKMDLLSKQNKELVESFLDPTPTMLLEDDRAMCNKKFHKLSVALARIIDDFSLVRFVPLDINDEESIGDLLGIIDNTIQYGEDLETRDRYPDEMDTDDGPENGKHLSDFYKHDDDD